MIIMMVVFFFFLWFSHCPSLSPHSPTLVEEKKGNENSDSCFLSVSLKPDK